MTYRVDFKCLDPENDLIRLELAGYPNAVISNNMISVYIEDPDLIEQIPLKGKKQLLKIETAQWENSWLKNFQGYEIDHELIILPEATNREYPHPFQLKIDPRDAFGDGHHPTTQMILQMLKSTLLSTETPQKIKLLDIGCGTGLAAILAAKLGVKNVLAYDISEAAVSQTIKNLKLNKLQAKVFQADLTEMETSSKQYDIVVANLLSCIIFDNLSKLKSLITVSGKLLISGIGEKWTAEAFEMFEKYQLKVSRHIQKQGWNCFLLVNKDN